MFRHLCTTMALGCVVLMLAPAGTTRATTILIDDFNDGNDDGWTRIDDSIGEPWGPGDFDLTSLTYHFLGNDDVPTGRRGTLGAFWDSSSDPFWSEGFFKATMRANNDTTLVFLVMRCTEASTAESNSFYIFGGNPANGALFFNKWDGELTVVRVPANEPFEPGEDWIIEAGAVGAELSMKVWKDGEQEPSEPQWQFTDPDPLGPGPFGVAAQHWRSGSTPPGIVDATFDDIFFTTVHEADFDLDGDVDGDDFLIWQASFGVDGGGDGDGDGDTDGDDFLIWQTEFGSGSGLAGAVVPEPASIVLLLAALVGAVFVQRRH
jgi:hypothetical protein